MKKTIFLVIAVLVFSFSLSQNLNAQCDPPWEVYSINGNWKGCDYTIYYCVLTDASGITHSKVAKIKADIFCAEDILNDQDFWASLSDIVLYHMLDNAEFSPCPLNSYNLVISRAECWKVHNKPHDTICEFLTCGEIGECIKGYKVCTDYLQIPPQNIWELVFTQATTSEMCSETWPDFSQYDWTQEWETFCFIISCD